MQLPTALRERLGAALERLDVIAIEAALKDIEAIDPEWAEGLRPHLQRFDYAKAAALLADPASD